MPSENNRRQKPEALSSPAPVSGRFTVKFAGTPLTRFAKISKKVKILKVREAQRNTNLKK